MLTGATETDLRQATVLSNLRDPGPDFHRREIESLGQRLDDRV
jgi:hypothetical protein